MRPLEMNRQAIGEAAIELAANLLTKAIALLTPHEKRQQIELNRMLDHPEDKATLTKITDQGFRSSSESRIADQMIHILDVQGIPRFFSAVDWTLLKGFQSFGGYLPGVAVPMVKEKMRKETANVILPAESELLGEHLRARYRDGLRMNVNFLGEALLGEGEARKRLDKYLAALQSPDIECLSVKISTLDSQISPLARQATVQRVSDRLELIYRAAAKERFRLPDGRSVPKFVYLDMEEYRDMWLTAAVFQETLARPGMDKVRAGIALQAYIPDSFLVLEQLADFALRRRATGGSPITLRIVKGANMEMERVEASLKDWPLAPFDSKIDTDANYKRMIEFALGRDFHDAIEIGIASHNLFDIAYAMIVASQRQAGKRIQFEMLEGMANHQRRAIHQVAENLLLYAPACQREEFLYAIGYLIRRLDENTGPDNFLRHTFHLEPGSETWNRLADGFRASLSRIDSVPSTPRRTQNRFTHPLPSSSPGLVKTEPEALADIDDNSIVLARGSRLAPQAQVNASFLSDPSNTLTSNSVVDGVCERVDGYSDFKNEPDTDFSLPHHSDWARSIVDTWQPRCDVNATPIRLKIAGASVEGLGQWHTSFDPSRPGVIAARYRFASAEQLAQAVACGHQDPTGWRTRPSSERIAILRRAAEELRRTRADLIGAAMLDGGKTVIEADAEVSEAVDFVEFYASIAEELFPDSRWIAKPLGLNVVVSPWNFPIAIPCGGMAAALAAGNTVILKPASDTALPAYLVCECFWRAGVPAEALQFAPCPGSLAQEQLIAREEVRAVILTGGNETAEAMLRRRPHLFLLAETGGKNATIVSGLSDRDMAIKNVLHSAFSHSGQKCSATSLLLLDDEIYQDKTFREQLIDAASSLPVGSVWDLRTKVGPLIRPPSGPLQRGLLELEQGESWALWPQRASDNPALFSPGIKWNVAPSSFTHMTELFGPVLGVMRYRHLHEAVDLVNATGFGLTSGLESLDDREQAFWRDKIKAGNLYINRSTTGAIVLRQPFGGYGKSCFGPGMKAGGPNYLLSLMTFESRSPVHLVREECVETSSRPRSLENFDWLRLAVQNEEIAEALLDAEAENAANEHEMRNELKQHFESLLASWGDYRAFAIQELYREHDHFDLVGQSNLRSYHPIGNVRLRLHESDSVFDLLRVVGAALLAGCRTTVSREPGIQEAFTAVIERLIDDGLEGVECVEENEARLLRIVERNQIDRLRVLSDTACSSDVQDQANQRGLYIESRPAVPFGRIELLRYVREQSLSFDYHRYGNLSNKPSLRQ